MIVTHGVGRTSSNEGQWLLRVLPPSVSSPHLTPPSFLSSLPLPSSSPPSPLPPPRGVYTHTLLSFPSFCIVVRLAFLLVLIPNHTLVLSVVHLPFLLFVLFLSLSYLLSIPRVCNSTNSNMAFYDQLAVQQQQQQQHQLQLQLQHQPFQQHQQQSTYNSPDMRTSLW